MGNYTRKSNEGLKALRKGYKREQYQSFMTGPEWFNVEISANLGGLLKEKVSFFHFPYFRQLAEIWRVFYESYSAARKYDSAYHVLFSDYMIMDLFVVLFTTAELLPKGLISLLFYPFLSKQNDTEMQQHLADYFAFFAQDIETKPFFLHDYDTHIKELSQKYSQCKSRTWTDWWTWTIVSLELRSKRFISGFLKRDYDLNEPMTTDIFVKFRAEVNEKEEAIRLFKDKLNEIDSSLDIHIVDDDLFVKDKNPNKPHTSVYARLTAPRYMPFRQAVHELAERDIHIRNIAGQDHVQVKCEVVGSDERTLEDYKDRLSKTEHATPLYSYGDNIHNNRRMCLFDVSAKNIDKTLDELEKNEGTKITFIHNF